VTAAESVPSTPRSVEAARAGSSSAGRAGSQMIVEAGPLTPLTVEGPAGIWASKKTLLRKAGTRS
jgi:hypothetical protein